MGRRIAWSLAALVLLTAAFGAGFYVGAGKGGEAIGSIANSNAVNAEIHRARDAVSDLSSDDPAQVQRNAEARLHSALRKLGELSPLVADFRTCHPVEIEAMTEVRTYLAAHPSTEENSDGKQRRVGAAICP